MDAIVVNKISLTEAVCCRKHGSQTVLFLNKTHNEGFPKYFGLCLDFLKENPILKLSMPH